MSETSRNDAETRLAGFWREDGLADHDSAFALAVMHRLARRRFQANLAWLGGVTLLATLVLGALAPWLAAFGGRLMERVAVFGPAAVVLVVVLSVIFISAPPRLRQPSEGALGDAPGA